MSQANAEHLSLADSIDAILPQTQCTQCGYPACRPYAEAVAEGKADINQCPPGGAPVIRDLARLLGVEPKPLDPEFGRENPEKAVAVIDEQLCIGCTLCIKACPVDAILGAAKLMHTVIARECTGCELCIAPCPVDCIAMIPVAPDSIRDDVRDREKANLARRRHQFRQRRLALEKSERAARLRSKREALQQTKRSEKNIDAEKAAIKAAILAAVERVRAKRATDAAPGENPPESEDQAAPGPTGKNK